MPDGTSVGPAVYTSRGAMPGPVNNAMYYAPPNAPPAVTLTSGWLGSNGSPQPVSSSGPSCANGNCDGAASGPSHPGLAHNLPAPAIPTFHGGTGILPTPGMAPAGAVAAVGVLPEIPPGPMFTGRSEVRFAEPVGMKVSWYGPSGWEGIPLETPAKYNFLQGGIYRLRLSAIPTRAGVTLYPTIQVFPGTAKTEAFLAHSSIPLNFSDEDFEQVGSGNYLVKVIYLPDPTYQDLAVVAGAHEMTFTRLEPGIDPVVEASKRGTVLLVVRMGNIDLQDPNTPAMDAPPPYPMPPGGLYPAGPAPVPGGPIVAPPLSSRGIRQPRRRRRCPSRHQPRQAPTAGPIRCLCSK